MTTPITVENIVQNVISLCKEQDCYSAMVIDECRDIANLVSFYGIDPGIAYIIESCTIRYFGEKR